MKQDTSALSSRIHSSWKAMLVLMLVVFSASFVFFSSSVDAAKPCGNVSITKKTIASAGQYLYSGCGTDYVDKETIACYPSLTGIVQTLLSAYTLILGIVGSLALLMFVWGGFQWLISGGSEKRITAGTTTLKNAVIGLLIVFGAWIGVNLIVATLNPSESGGPRLAFQSASEQWWQIHKGDICLRPLSSKELAEALAVPVKTTEYFADKEDEKHFENLKRAGETSQTKEEAENNAKIKCPDSDANGTVEPGKDFIVRNSTYPGWFSYECAGLSCKGKGFDYGYQINEGEAARDACNRNKPKPTYIVTSVDTVGVGNKKTACCSYKEGAVDFECKPHGEQGDSLCSDNTYCEDRDFVGADAPSSCVAKLASDGTKECNRRRQCESDVCYEGKCVTRGMKDLAENEKGVCCYNIRVESRTMVGVTVLEGRFFDDYSRKDCNELQGTIAQRMFCSGKNGSRTCGQRDGPLYVEAAWIGLSECYN